MKIANGFDLGYCKRSRCKDRSWHGTGFRHPHRLWPACRFCRKCTRTGYWTESRPSIIKENFWDFPGTAGITRRLRYPIWNRSGSKTVTPITSSCMFFAGKCFTFPVHFLRQPDFLHNGIFVFSMTGMGLRRPQSRILSTSSWPIWTRSARWSISIVILSISCREFSSEIGRKCIIRTIWMTVPCKLSFII